MQSNEIFEGDTFGNINFKKIFSKIIKKYISRNYKKIKNSKSISSDFFIFPILWIFRYFRNSKFKKKSTHTHFFFGFFFEFFLCVNYWSKKNKMKSRLFFCIFLKFLLIYVKFLLFFSKN
jgi:hypothetical protein